MVSSLIQKEAVIVILSPGQGLEDFSVALNLHLRMKKFCLKK